jgi:hypothetical protein
MRHTFWKAGLALAATLCLSVVVAANPQTQTRKAEANRQSGYGAADLLS